MLYQHYIISTTVSKLFVNIGFLGILESSSEDFETATDVYDAVGELLYEISESNPNVVNEVCEQLIRILKMWANINFFTQNYVTQNWPTLVMW